MSAQLPRFHPVNDGARTRPALSAHLESGDRGEELVPRRRPLLVGAVARGAGENLRLPHRVAVRLPRATPSAAHSRNPTLSHSGTHRNSTGYDGYSAADQLVVHVWITHPLRMKDGVVEIILSTADS